MICIVALVVFGILGIFSASHRRIAKEAFSCVFRRMTLRKCDTGFDNKMKVRLSTGLFKFSPILSKFTFKHFEAISWVLTIIMFASFAYSAWSVYNLFAFGNCNGQNSSEVCVLNLGGYSCSNTSCLGEECNCTPDKNCSDTNTGCPSCNFTPIS